MSLNIQFFWDKKQRRLNRSRFNLLLLEFGEYFLEDFSAYHFPLPTNDIAQSFEIQDGAKIQGRIKLCSRSIIFEPNDIRHPVLRFPYRYVIAELQKFNLKAKEANRLSIQLTGFFTFVCTQYHEMKAHNKIGPYKTVEYNKAETTGSNISGYRLLFALVHSDLEVFFVKIEQFRHIHKISEKQGINVANLHLQPFIENALVTNFDSTNLVNFHEKFLIQTPLNVRRIRPLITTPGSLMITEQRIYFQPAQLNNIDEQLLSFEIGKILRIYKKRHMLKSIGVEFLLSEGIAYLFVFENISERDRIYELIIQQATSASIALNSFGSASLSPYTGVGGPASLFSPYGGISVPTVFSPTSMYGSNSLNSDPFASPTGAGGSQKLTLSVLELMKKWQKREITNFEYLIHLNYEADRTFNDLTQYPVFPHVIADYKSRKLDYTNPRTFRDLSKPVGALNPERLKYFKDRYYTMPPGDIANGVPTPFLYGTHYSTPGYVLYYLVRVAPEYMLCLQNGRFDVADRMFHSIPDTWESCLSNPADLKELIPEFYTGNGEFLLNYDDLDLGRRHSGERLHDVVLPPWADSPRDFIRKNVKALESDYVSEHLHEWIDLIFGCKQQGPAAEEADNVFYYLTYEGAVDIDKITDPREKLAIESQIQEFGQTPKQLFLTSHPSRNDATVTVQLASQQGISTTTTTSSSSSSNAAAGTTSGNRSRTGSNESRNSISGMKEDPNTIPTSSTTSSVNTGSGVFVEDNTNASAAAIGRTVSPSIRSSITLGSLKSGLGFTKRASVTAPTTTPTPANTSTTAAASGKSTTGGVSHAVSPTANAAGIASGGGGSTPNAGTTNKPQISMLDLLSPKDRELLNMPSAPTGTTHEDISESIEVIHLGEDFRQAVEHAEMNERLTEDGSNSARGKTTSGLGRALGLFGLGGSQKQSPTATTTAATAIPTVDINTLRLFPSEPSYWHSKPIASLSVKIVAVEGNETDYTLPLSGRRKLIAIVGAAAKHSMLKIIRVEQDLNLQDLMSSSSVFSGTISSNPKFISDAVARTSFTISRSYSASASSLSSCVLSNDGNRVLFGSWDNHVYGYSITNATSIGKRFAHYDGITSLSLNKSNKWLLSGSLDGTVKLWLIKTAASNIIGQSPSIELADHEYPVECVAINNDGEYGAGGGEDGTVIVWDLNQQTVLFSHGCTSGKKRIKGLKWLPINEYTSMTGFSPNKILISTEDGKLLCMDITGKMFASMQIDTAINCIDSDGKIIVGGCSDGSVRAWTIQQGKFKELQRTVKAHAGAVTAIALGEHAESLTTTTTGSTIPPISEIMVTGSENCSTRVWRLAYEK